MNIKKIEILWNDNSKDVVDGDVVAGKSAEKIRNRQAKQISVTF